MTSYYEILEAIETFAKEGKYEEAKKILSEHLNEEHQMEASISETIRELHIYQQNLVTAKRFLSTSLTSQAITSIETAKSALYRLETQLGGLVDNKKITLRQLK